ncbi:glycosyltransferase, partial [bacterium]|nr:glycosyltransferase [bacterium]
EMERSRFRRGVEFIPNSFDVDSDLTRDNMIRPPSDREPLRLVMSASFFSGWHGLDRILDALEQEEEEAWELHLAGRLPEDLQQRVARLKSVISHGHLGRDELRKLYLSCHVGLSSFSLERMGLTQATTLKVREYLSLGLPVVLGHVDPALPEDFPFALRQESFNLAGIVSFISSIGNHSRREVAESSVPYIDTLPVLNKLLSFCSRVLHEQSCGETR